MSCEMNMLLFSHVHYLSAEDKNLQKWLKATWNTNQASSLIQL